MKPPSVIESEGVESQENGEQPEIDDIQIEILRKWIEMNEENTSARDKLPKLTI